VRSQKVGSTSKSFHKKADAVAWAKVQEAAMQTGEWKPKDKRYSTIGDLIQKYLKKVTPQKKGAEPETRRLNRLLKEKSLMSIKLDEAKPHHFAPSEISELKMVTEHANTIWFCFVQLGTRLVLSGAGTLAIIRLTLIRFPKNNPPRERSLKQGEYES